MAIDNLPFDDRLPNWRKLNKDLRLGSFRLSAGVVLSLTMLGIGTEFKGCTPEEPITIPNTVDQKTSITAEKAMIDSVSENSQAYGAVTEEYTFHISERYSMDE